MTIEEIYQLAIKMGIEADPRGKAGVERALRRKRKEYEEIPKKKRKDFDLESLKNPYSDTRILFGNPGKKVKKILAGIDISPAEVILADRLNQKGKGIDLLLGHHPHGVGLTGLYEVVDLQVDMLAKYGVPVNIAEGLLKERIAEVKRKIYPLNHFQSVDTARLLQVPFLCTHTPTDNLVFQFLAKLFNRKKPEIVGEVVEILKEIPEYQKAAREKAGPTIAVGEEKNRCGKVTPIEITGGTEGAKKIYQYLAQAGVGTIISMHQSEGHLKEAKKYHLNIIIAGHMASDSLGINLFLDKLMKKGIDIFTCSGLNRVSR